MTRSSSPNFALESKLLKKFKWVAGVDEAGRGAWAGPVVAAVVCLRPSRAEGLVRLGVTDSKQLSFKKRTALCEVIKNAAVAYQVAFIGPKRIDKINILAATKEAMLKAYLKMTPRPQVLIIDYLKLEALSCHQESVKKGDEKIISVAAASILAKVSRDEFMQRQAGQYPGYGFKQNKGYGTRQHKEGLKTLGACPLHRKSYQPIKETLVGWKTPKE